METKEASNSLASAEPPPTTEEDILMQIIAAENFGNDLNPFNDPGRHDPVARAMMDDYLQPGAGASRSALRSLFKQSSTTYPSSGYTYPSSSSVSSSSSPSSSRAGKEKEKDEKLEALKREGQEPKKEEGKDTGDVYVWGQAVDGQLGLGNKKSHQLAPVVVKKISDKSIRMVACGRCHTVALADNGDVYTWGGGICGQLGHNKRGVLPTIVPSIQGVNVRSVYCGASHTICLTDMGKILAFGLNTSGELGLGHFLSPQSQPVIVDKMEAITVVSIACGASHTLAISAEGNLYSWGRNDNQQLGLTHRNNIHTPALVRKLFKKKCIAAAGGVAHSAVVTARGRVYTFGRGRHGRLGHGDALDKQPEIVKALEFRKVVAISCGWQHTCALDSEGCIYTWGCGKQGQLGHGNRNDQKLPKLLNSDEVYRSVVCGDRHTAAVTENGICYLWGSGAAGKLGIGTVDQDALVPALLGGLHTRHIRQIAPGGNHTVALVGGQTALAMDLRKLLNSQEFSDITLIAGDRPIYAHKVILASRSPVFRRIVSPGFESTGGPQEETTNVEGQASSPMVRKRRVVPKELVIQDIPYQAFFSLIEYLYTDATHITPVIVEELLIAALEYQLPRLARLCVEFMQEKGLSVPDSIEGVEKEGETSPSLQDDIFMALRNCKELSDIVFKISAPVSQKKKAPETPIETPASTQEGEQVKQEKDEKGKEKESTETPVEAKGDKPKEEKLLVDRHEDYRFVYAHKCILAARSDYFKVMFAAGMKESEFTLDFDADDGAEEEPDIPAPSFDTDDKGKGKEKEGDNPAPTTPPTEEKPNVAAKSFGGLLAERSIPIEGISFETFAQIVKFVYSGQVRITPHTVTELLMSSNQYRLSALKQLATGFIEEHISTDNVIEILTMADHFSFTRLATFALDYALKHLETVKKDTPVDVWNTIPESLMNKIEGHNQNTRVKKDMGRPWKIDDKIHVLEQDLYGKHGATYSDLKVTKQLANAIKDARAAKGVSRKDLARMIAVKETVITEYETAKVVPNMAVLRKMERALGAKFAQLVPSVGQKK